MVGLLMKKGKIVEKLFFVEKIRLLQQIDEINRGEIDFVFLQVF